MRCSWDILLGKIVTSIRFYKETEESEEIPAFASELRTGREETEEGSIENAPFVISLLNPLLLLNLRKVWVRGS